MKTYRSDYFWAAIALGAFSVGNIWVTQYGWVIIIYGVLLFLTLIRRYRASFSVFISYWIISAGLCLVYSRSDLPRTLLTIGFNEILDWAAFRLVCFLTIFGVIKIVYARFPIHHVFYNIVYLAASIGSLCGHGIFPNASLSSSFCCWLLPSVSVIFWPLAIITALRQPGAMPYVVLAAYATYAIVFKKKWKYLAPAMGSIVFSLWYFAGNKSWAALVESDRFQMYRYVFHYWKLHFNPWLGAGFGGYPTYALTIQDTYEFGQSVWISLHNDWLTALFEGGYIGLAITAWLFVDLIRQTKNGERAMVIAYGLIAIPWFPTQAPLWLFMLGYLCIPFLIRWNQGERAGISYSYLSRLDHRQTSSSAWRLEAPKSS